MTLFLSFRSASRAGGLLTEPQVLESSMLDERVSWRPLTALPAERFVGREIVFVTHGFNVNLERGVRSLTRLEQALSLPPGFVVIGVLWPGDWWIPVINYPAEAGDAVRCGRYLSTFCNDALVHAAAFSFVSHSLGARVVLECVKRLKRKAREVCVMAAAADDDCLTSKQYDRVRGNAQRVSVLASKGDRVLRIAYPLGDFFSDVFYDDDRATRAALGYHGPRPLPPEAVVHSQIPGRVYRHDDYLPSDDLRKKIEKQHQPIQWVSEALRGLPFSWP